MWQMSANWLPPSPVPPRCRVLALASPRRGHDLPPPSRASVTVTVCGHGHSAVELAMENQWNSIYSISMVHDGDIIIKIYKNYRSDEILSQIFKYLSI